MVKVASCVCVSSHLRSVAGSAVSLLADMFDIDWVARTLSVHMRGLHGLG